MVEFLHPGIYVTEEDSAPAIVGVGTSGAGIVGFTKRGPTDAPGFASNFTEWSRLYGGFYNDGYMAYAAKAFFDQGGTRLYTMRVVPSAAVAALTTVKPAFGPTTLAGVNKTIDVVAKDKGAWGNNVGITTRKCSTTISTTALTATNTTIQVADASQFEVGDIITGTDGTAYFSETVTAIDTVSSPNTLKTSTMQLRVNATGATSVGTLAVGTTIETASRHRARSLLNNAAAVINTDTSVVVVNSANFQVGDLIHVIDTATGAGGRVIEGRILNIDPNTNTLTFTNLATTGSGTVPATTGIVVTQDFNIQVIELGSVVETHTFLSLESANVRNYVTSRLSGTGNQSSYLSVTDSVNVDVAGTLGLELRAERYPRPVLNAVLTTGSDAGAAPTSNELQTGRTFLDSVDDVVVYATPGATDAASLKAGFAAAELSGRKLYIGSVPSASSTSTSAISAAVNFRNQTLNYYTSYGALYYPWLNVPDQARPDQQITVPPEGHMLGVMADVAQRRGVHKAPANERLKNVLSTTRVVLDAEQDLLNPIGINAIRSITGRGIVIYGARTLNGLVDKKQYIGTRRLLNYIKSSLTASLQSLTFEPNDEDLYRTITRACEQFLTTLWEGGALFPRTDVKKAFYVRCSTETTTNADRNAGKVNCIIGVSPSLPAEFIVFRVTLFDGGSPAFAELSQ